jgi:hypothetical protein
VPEFPHFDFIILVQMEDTASHEKLLAQLKQIPIIELAAPIPLEGLKSKTNFIF